MLRVSKDENAVRAVREDRELKPVDVAEIKEAFLQGLDKALIEIMTMPKGSESAPTPTSTPCG